MEDRFRRLIEPEWAKALAFARAISRSRGDGDDLCQEAAMRAMAKLDTLRDEGAFRSWFFRILITVHRNRGRRSFWRRFLQLSDPIVADAPEASAGDYRVASWSPDAAESARRAREALAKLPPEQRESIVLFEIEDWRVEEIATLQGVSVSAVKSRLARGRARLRAYYAKRFGAETVPSFVTGASP